MSKPNNPPETRFVDFSGMAEKWPSTHVSRKEVGKFTGGLLNPRTLANLDSLGQGPKKKIRLGNKLIAYPVDVFINWLNERIKGA